MQAVEKDADVRKTFRDLKAFGDNVTALMDLSAGRLDAVVVDEVVGRYYTAKKTRRVCRAHRTLRHRGLRCWYP